MGEHWGMCTDYQCISVIKLCSSSPASLGVLLPGLRSNWLTMCGASLHLASFSAWHCQEGAVDLNRETVFVFTRVCFYICDVAAAGRRWLTGSPASDWAQLPRSLSLPSHTFPRTAVSPIFLPLLIGEKDNKACRLLKISLLFSLPQCWNWIIAWKYYICAKLSPCACFMWQ